MGFGIPPLKLKIKRHDTWPPVRLAIKNADGTAFNLTGATAKFQMRLAGTLPLVVDAAAAIFGPAIDGVLEYEWAPADTAALGEYEAEFEVLLPEKLHAPSGDKYIQVEIFGDLDDA